LRRISKGAGSWNKKRKKKYIYGDQEVCRLDLKPFPDES
jgi:hypothetical protein